MVPKATSRQSEGLIEHPTTDYLRLEKSSLLLSCEEYMNLMFKFEYRKIGIEESKQRKKELAKEKRDSGIAATTTREKERLERQKPREEKEHKK